MCPGMAWVCCVQGACAVPWFCSRPFSRGSWAFQSLCFFCPEFVQLRGHVVFSPHRFSEFCCLRRAVQVQALQRCSGGTQAPACPTPPERLHSLILKGERPEFSSEALACRQGLQTRAYPQGTEVPRQLVQGPGGTWATFSWNGLNSLVIVSLTSNCWGLKDMDLTKRLSKHGLKGTRTAVEQQSSQWSHDVLSLALFYR